MMMRRRRRRSWLPEADLGPGLSPGSALLPLLLLFIFWSNFYFSSSDQTFTFHLLIKLLLFISFLIKFFVSFQLYMSIVQLEGIVGSLSLQLSRQQSEVKYNDKTRKNRRRFTGLWDGQLDHNWTKVSQSQSRPSRPRWGQLGAGAVQANQDKTKMGAIGPI